MKTPCLKLFSLLMLVLCLGGIGRGQTPLKARHGVMDLRTVDLARGGAVHLDGEWECYWGRLVEPGALPVAGSPPYLSLPGAWNGRPLGSMPIPSTGMATLRLKVLLPSGPTPLGLRLCNIQSAYRVWINGAPSGGSGELGASQGEETPNPAILIHALPKGVTEAEILLQITNQHFHQGGVLASIALGEIGKLQANQARSWGRVLFFAGSLLMMGIYHLVIYWFRKDSTATLLFGTYCILWAGFMLVVQTHGLTLRLFFPELAFEDMERAKQCFLFLTVPVGFAFFQVLYPQELSRRVLLISVAMAAAATLLALVLPTRALFFLLTTYYLPTFGFMFYCLFGLYLAHRRQREGATFILAGFLILGLTGLHDAMAALAWLPPGPWIQLGMMVFILIQALTLSLRLSKAFTAVEHLSSVLDLKNLALEQEIQERGRLERDIVKVSEDERRTLSHELHDGICQQITGALLRCRVVARNLKTEGQDDSGIQAISELLDESLGQAHEIAKGLSPGLLNTGGLGNALAEVVRRTRETHELSCELEDDESCALLDEVATNQLFWIARESILNAVKHSSPTQIWVRLRRVGGTLRLEVENDGTASELSRGAGMGLRIMGYRASLAGGSIDFNIRKGGGWLVTCLVPFPTTSPEPEMS